MNENPYNHRLCPVCQRVDKHADLSREVALLSRCRADIDWLVTHGKLTAQVCTDIGPRNLVWTVERRPYGAAGVAITQHGPVGIDDPDEDLQVLAYAAKAVAAGRIPEEVL